MADLTKTITGIEHCLGRYVDGLCDDCPYMGAIDKTYMIPMKCKEIIMRDALELLKDRPKIVRCKDCTDSTDLTYAFPVRGHMCNRTGYFYEGNHFCSDGKPKDRECVKNCLNCSNSFSDEEDHLHCMADGHNHEEIVADGHTCNHWN